MASTQHPIFTIGHSNHSIGAFISLLHEHDIHEVVDVRSSPYSRYTPHFNFDVINGALEQKGIGYAFRGGELGGRPADQSCYDADGRVLYDRIADTDLFDGSIGSLVRSADEHRITMMCAEKEPLDCHRTLLIAPALAERGVDVEHILADGSLESHDAAMDRLMGSFKLPPHGDMFRSRNEVVTEALYRQARKVAHVAQSLPPQANVGVSCIEGVHDRVTKKSASRFFGLLRDSGAKRLIDVRLNNVSQLAGFAKKDDLEYFLNKICRMKYVHLPELAPTKEMLDSYRKGHHDWQTYESEFLSLMDQRRIGKRGIKRIISNGCLLCSEDTPDHCHRRLVAEYLQRSWGDLEIVHLG